MYWIRLGDISKNSFYLYIDTDGYIWKIDKYIYIQVSYLHIYFFALSVEALKDLRSDKLS